MRKPRNHPVYVGLQFVVFIVFATTGLTKVVQGRVDVRDAQQEVNDFRAPADAQRKRERRKKEESDKMHEEVLVKNEELKMKKVPRPKGSWW